jgi:hypothetical protein
LNLDPLSEVVEVEMTYLVTIWISSKLEGDLSSSRRYLLLHFEVTLGVESREAAVTLTVDDPFVTDLEH